MENCNINLDRKDQVRFFGKKALQGIRDERFKTLTKLKLTHYCPKKFSSQILKYSLRYALILYRLIGSAFIGNLFHDQLKKNEF